jgi:drug/metabolite transporter (DMT)-like permease
VNSDHPRHPRAPLAAATTAVIVWGIGPLFVKAIDTSGLVVASYRMALGAPVMWLINRLMGGRVTVDLLRVAAPAGVLFAGDIVLGFSSFEHTSLAIATIIGALFPALVLLVSGPLFGERVRRLDLVWFALALAGTATVVSFGRQGSDTSALGVVLSAASLVSWTAYFLYVKRKRLDGVPAFAFMTAVIATGACVLAPYTLIVSNDVGTVRGFDFAWLFALILLPGAAGHGLMTWAHGYLSANVASILTLAGPVVTIAGAWRFFDQALTAAQFGGIVAVFVAIGLVLLGHSRIGDEVLEDEPVAGVVA